MWGKAMNKAPEITVVPYYLFVDSEFCIYEDHDSDSSRKWWSGVEEDFLYGFYDEESNEIVVSAAGVLHDSEIVIVDGRLHAFFPDAFAKTVAHETLHYLMANEETTEEEEEWALERLGLA